MTYGIVWGLGALSNGSVVSLCDRATTLCPATGELRLQLSGAGAHVVADVLGYFTTVKRAGRTRFTADGSAGARATRVPGRAPGA